MTQAALAERAGVSVKYLQRVEWGHENLTVASLVTLANLLRVAPIDLFKPARLRNAKPGRPPMQSKRDASAQRSRVRKTVKR
jgi:transcriptional regulator with XRE-family HTH domain